MRLVDAHKLYEQYETAMRELVKSTNCENISLKALSLLCGTKLIADAPTVEAAPVAHGQWIHCKGKSNLWYCSVCGEKIIYNPTRKTYKPDKKPVWEINKCCRNCGAHMDLEE